MSRREQRLALIFVAPVFGAIALIALVPLAGTFWEALHQHDLRLPWLGRPLVGFDNFAEAFSDPRFLAALGRTAAFAAVSVTLELTLGVALAVVLHARFRGRGAARAAVLMPWAIPTVVGALVWRFLFERYAGAEWLTHPIGAWLPIVLADAWKTTPFVALLVLAGLQQIDPALDEAAQMDGAGPWQRFRAITWPLLRPAVLVALVFRTLDALRVFDTIYVLTGGGPGTSTEPISLYAFIVLMQRLRFGYGSALSILVFVITFGFALAYIRLVGRRALEGAR